MLRFTECVNDVSANYRKNENKNPSAYFSRRGHIHYTQSLQGFLLLFSVSQGFDRAFNFSQYCRIVNS